MTLTDDGVLTATALSGNGCGRRRAYRRPPRVLRAEDRRYPPRTPVRACPRGWWSR